MNSLKSLIDLNNGKLDKLICLEQDVNEKFVNLKSDICSTWADVVKKDIEKISDEVKIVQKSITGANEMNEREKI